MNSRHVVRLQLRLGVLLVFGLGSFGWLVLKPAIAQTVEGVESNSPKLAGQTCLSAVEATSHTNHDICLNAHVFNVIELADGTRFLDVCPPETSDQDCRFTVVSKKEDRNDVGDLRRFRDQDVHVRSEEHTSELQS